MSATTGSKLLQAFKKVHLPMFQVNTFLLSPMWAKATSIAPDFFKADVPTKHDQNLRSPSSVPAPAHSQPAKPGLEERQQTADSLHSHQSSLALWTPHDLPLCSGGLVGCVHSGISMLTLKRQNQLPVLNEHQWERCPLSTSEESRRTWEEKERHAAEQSPNPGKI